MHVSLREYVEWALVALLAAGAFSGAFSARPAAARVARRALACLDRAGRRPHAAALALIAAGFLTSALISFAVPYYPFIQDEFSYLLGADTFASGRLTNPPHPMGEHFETFQQLQRPSRQSKYPPAQATMLAAGQILSGHAIVGVWLSMGLACASALWAARAFLPAGWTLLVGVAPLLRLGVFEGESGDYFQWCRAYWGGAVAFIGGALVYGAALRLLKRERKRDAWLLAAGIIVLLNSRPFEAMFAITPAAAVLAWTWLQRKPAAALVTTLSAGLSLGVGVTMLYNSAVTGDALRLPYVEYEQQYEVAPALILLPLRPEPEYRNEPMRRWHAEDRVGVYRERRASRTFRLEDLPATLQFFLGPVLFVGLAAVAASVVRDARLRLAAAAVALTYLSQAVTLPPAVAPHYLAPAAPMLYVLATSGLRGIAASRRGRTFVVGCITILLLGFALSLIANNRLADQAGKRFGEHRYDIQQHLEATPGNHLVLVRYSAEHPSWQEWVYNRADIDASKLVWARELAPKKNERLLDYFADRQAWLIEPDLDARRLVPYPRP